MIYQILLNRNPFCYTIGMKRNTFLLIFVSLNILFIFLQIFKQSYIIKLSYEKQRNEKLRNSLLAKKASLTEQLYILKNQSTIKQFATDTLGMKPIRLNQIRRAV